MQKFIVDDAFWKIFPDARIAVLSLKDVDETARLSDEEMKEIAALLDKANKEAVKYVPNETISDNPVVQVWRQAYQKFPTKKGARCALENLLKRVLHGNPVGSIVPSVDLTNAVSLKYAFPIGVENMDAFAGDLHLGVMDGTEDFLPIGEAVPEPPLKGEVAYRDDAGVVCRCWNWRDGQRTQVNDDTTNEFVAMECVEEDRLEDLQKALNELAELLPKYLGAQVMARAIVDRDHPEVVLREEVPQQNKAEESRQEVSQLPKAQPDDSGSYDDYTRTECTTTIRDVKDDWYAFNDTVFYGDKGGMPSDSGTINGQKVDGLKWEGETLWHHVEGAPLQDPIVMKVDFELRYAHTVPQTALHILDSYYRRKGMLITSTGCCEDNEYYDLDVAEISPRDWQELQDYINEAIRKDAPVHFHYVKGSDYPDPEYRKFETVRIVEIEGLDEQPCGTPHLNHTGEIGSFVLLDWEHRSKSTVRVYFTAGNVTRWRLVQYYKQLNRLAQMLSTSNEDLEEKAAAVTAANKEYKKQINDLTRSLMEHEAKDYAEKPEKVIELTGGDSDRLRPLSQALMRVCTDTKILYAANDMIDFAIVSREGRAREILEILKPVLNCSGGGSPKIVSGRTSVDLETFKKAVEELHL
ncbi:phenylalanine--tRNA ligase beta subunit-related protein [Anaerolactibacter massiliensis]|jgi:DNA/RNA-binding domain of Phe-tRNA-synthetase-like protein/Ser-tRNA(Ala) deacylase AlaX|uniref:phenylalanine--tRNA ligase beta subunit-related protein n=1 Tax=Anaerolactibacter massiliensis TaxID=2044573 RepID=UPI000CF928AC|nr:phenylalanine--tRNA ligase beta subunit-related protein [Anaerolactibacter massiliensis]